MGKLATALWLGLAAPACSAEWVPVAKLDLLGGQFFFEDQNTSFSGNADWLLSPGVRLSDRDLLVPTFSGQYRRTREVRELLGGGFLTQEQLDNMAAVKWVHAFDQSWAVKPNVSFKNELITESRDETLGKGLFDYNKLGFGVELERRGERLKSLRQSLNVYGVRFTHYRSLASEQQALLGVEINAGSRVLDFNGYDYTVSGDYLVGDKTLLSGAWLTSYRPFLDQRIVALNGAFTQEMRRDLYFYWSLGAQRKLPDLTLRGRSVAELIGGLGLSYTRLFSNQNDYEAARTRFNPTYYNYGEFAATPSFAMKFAGGHIASLSYEYTRRDYSKRPVRDSKGNYVPGLIRMEGSTVSIGLTYVLTRNLSFKTQGAYRVATSNMKFERAYRYNYTSSHYFVGLAYAL